MDQSAGLISQKSRVRISPPQSTLITHTASSYHPDRGAEEGRTQNAATMHEKHLLSFIVAAFHVLSFSVLPRLPSGVVVCDVTYWQVA